MVRRAVHLSGECTNSRRYFAKHLSVFSFPLSSASVTFPNCRFYSSAFLAFRKHAGLRVRSLAGHCRQRLQGPTTMLMACVRSWSADEVPTSSSTGPGSTRHAFVASSQ